MAYGVSNGAAYLPSLSMGKWLETELLKAASGGSLEKGRERRGVEENRAVPSIPEARTVVPPPSSGVRYLFWDLERS